jgi:hypothetical protein
LTYSVSINSEQELSISIFKPTEPLFSIENLCPNSMRFTPNVLTSSLLLRENSSVYIKVTDSWLFKDKKGLNLDGYSEIQSGRFVHEYPYAALLYSFNNVDWFYLGGKQQLQYPELKDSKPLLYLRLNCADITGISGFADIEYSVIRF